MTHPTPTEKLPDELAEARETIKRLNRRCQEAECALKDAMNIIDNHWENPWCSGNLGRALLAYENSRLKRDHGTTVADEREKILAWIEAEAEHQSHSQITRKAILNCACLIRFEFHRKGEGIEFHGVQQ